MTKKELLALINHLKDDDEIFLFIPQVSDCVDIESVIDVTRVRYTTDYMKILAEKEKWSDAELEEEIAKREFEYNTYILPRNIHRYEIQNAFALFPLRMGKKLISRTFDTIEY